MQPSNIKKFFNNFITIYRKTSEGDDFGGMNSVWEKKNWNVPCRIYGSRGFYSLNVEGKRYNISKKMMCNKDTDIKYGDKITDDNAGDSLLVMEVKNIRTLKKVDHIECLLSRLE